MWKVAATSLHNDVLLNAEECHEREAKWAHATLVFWWEALRATEVAKWQQR